MKSSAFAGAVLWAALMLGCWRLSWRAAAPIPPATAVMPERPGTRAGDVRSALADLEDEWLELSETLEQLVAAREHHRLGVRRQIGHARDPSRRAGACHPQK